MKKQLDLVKKFCYIELQILKDRELRLRKEIQECHLQKEFINGIIEEFGNMIIRPAANTEEN